MDGSDVHQSGHGLHLRASRALFLRLHQGQHAVHHQSHHGGHGACHRLGGGVRSGRDYDKWKETGLTPHAGVAVECPYVEESPLSLECVVRQVIPLGSHHMFLAEVVNVLADEALFDAETDAFRLEEAGLLNYTHGHYYTQGDAIGRFGFSVMKKPGAKD